VGQLRRLAVLADARSRDLAESVLRLHWAGAALPTPTPGVPVVAGGRMVRLALVVISTLPAVVAALRAQWPAGWMRGQ
jgi:hypothetical protein